VKATKPEQGSRSMRYGTECGVVDLWTCGALLILSQGPGDDRQADRQGEQRRTQAAGSVFGGLLCTHRCALLRLVSPSQRSSCFELLQCWGWDLQANGRHRPRREKEAPSDKIRPNQTSDAVPASRSI
jgi:hypothetical protein